MAELAYKSFCWSFGTTSFRTKNFNKTIEGQLRLLDRFWQLPGMEEVGWSNEIIQEKYYDLCKVLKDKYVDNVANQEETIFD